MATAQSLSDEPSVGAGQHKPAKVESSSSSGHELPTDPLRISVLRWLGTPTDWNADGNDPIEYGRHVSAVRSAPLTAVGWSEEHNAFVYRPPPGRTIQFTHQRSTYIGTHSSWMTESGAVFGEADEQDPILLVHCASRVNTLSAFCASFKPRHWNYRDADFTGGPKRMWQPPFVHETGYMPQTVNIKPSTPTRAKIVPLSLPDLELHRAAIEEGIGAESEDEDEDHASLEDMGEDFTGMHWHGDWTRKFIQDARSGSALAPLEKPVIWDRAHVWGVRVHLEPIRSSVKVDRIKYAHEDDRDPENASYGGLRKLRLQSYETRDTISEVYVSPAFFEEMEDDTYDSSDTESEKTEEDESDAFEEFRAVLDPVYHAA